MDLLPMVMNLDSIFLEQITLFDLTEIVSEVCVIYSSVSSLLNIFRAYCSQMKAYVIF